MYRSHVQETNRDHCSTIGLNHWVRNVICSGSDKTQTYVLMTELNLSLTINNCSIVRRLAVGRVREQVQDCSGDELVGELASALVWCFVFVEQLFCFDNCVFLFVVIVVLCRI